MKLKSEVTKLDATGDWVHVTLSNVRSPKDATWQPYRPSITLGIHQSQCRAFPIGKEVTLIVKP